MSSPTKIPTKALVDTTVLTDALLKPTNEGETSRRALKRYEETILPQYALKEFKLGPLRGYIWFHTKVMDCGWQDAVRAIPRLFRQYNKMSTAQRALADFNSSISRRLTSQLAEKYPGQTYGDVQDAEGALWLKTRIVRAWRSRRTLTTRVVAPLSCYTEREPKLMSNGRFDDKPVLCGVDDCCLRKTFTSNRAELEQLVGACKNLPPKPETDKRRRALKELLRQPTRQLSERDCRSLGDAVFAVQCPKDAVILTTNIKDHQPIATALGVAAVSP